jgi:hypothetical protein
MTELRQLLLDAVPELPAPPDRLTAVAARVHRGRRVAVGLAVVAVVAAVGLGVAVFRPGPARPEAAETGCPTRAAMRPLDRGDRPGPLVPDGAVRVALCRTGSEPDRPSLPAQVLTTGVSSLLTLLNELPPPDEEGVCQLMLYPYAFSFLFRYADRPPVLVEVDQNCGTVSADGRTRGYISDSGSPLDRFAALYRSQQAAGIDPATIDAPECPQSLALANNPRDDISNGKGLDGMALPTELAVATLCRYAGSQLSVSTAYRDGLPQLRDSLNATVAAGQPATCWSTPNVVDAVLAVDRLGGVVEFWVLRTPCQTVIRTGPQAITPSRDLLERLDGMLGSRPPG